MLNTTAPLYVSIQSDSGHCERDEQGTMVHVQ